ncbi:MAG: ABC transporter substrate-binding protein, partial [bacterium]
MNLSGDCKRFESGWRTCALILAACGGIAAMVAGCGKGNDADKPKKEQSGDPTVISAWAHSGRESERRTIKEQVQRFNRNHDAIKVELEILPEGTYDSQVQSAALADDLPDVLEFDGPFIYNYAWQGHLIPIGNRLSQPVLDNLLPSIIDQGT